MKRLANKVVKELQARGLTLAIGESSTCGLTAYKLSTVKGTLDVLKGSLVCYHPETKTKALGIPASFIKKYTPESRQVTDAIAKKLSRLFDADIYIGITGLCAPGGSETKSKPVGTTFISVLYQKNLYISRKIFKGSPLSINTQACKATYKLVLNIISANPY